MSSKSVQNAMLDWPRPIVNLPSFWPMCLMHSVRPAAHTHTHARTHARTRARTHTERGRRQAGGRARARRHARNGSCGEKMRQQLVRRHVSGAGAWRASAVSLAGPLPSGCALVEARGHGAIAGRSVRKTARAPRPARQSEQHSGRSDGGAGRACAYFSSSVCFTAVRGKYTSMACIPTPCMSSNAGFSPGLTCVWRRTRLATTATPTCDARALAQAAQPRERAARRSERPATAPRTLDDSLVSNTSGSVRSTILVDVQGSPPRLSLATAMPPTVPRVRYAELGGAGRLRGVFLTLFFFWREG